MLIECQHCHVSFDASFRKCIVCGTAVVLSQDAERRFCIEVVEQLAAERNSTSTIRQYLIESELFSKAEIKKIIHRLKSSHEVDALPGHIIVSIGVLLFGVGAGSTEFFGVTIISIPCILVGASFIVFGLIAIRTVSKPAKQNSDSNGV